MQINLSTNNSNRNFQNDKKENFKRSSLDDTTLDFTRSMYSFGGIEYFLTEKDFCHQDLCQRFS